MDVAGRPCADAIHWKRQHRIGVIMATQSLLDRIGRDQARQSMSDAVQAAVAEARAHFVPVTGAWSMACRAASILPAPSSRSRPAEVSRAKLLPRHRRAVRVPFRTESASYCTHVQASVYAASRAICAIGCTEPLCSTNQTLGIVMNRECWR